jgi:hypothetical protein
VRWQSKRVGQKGRKANRIGDGVKKERRREGRRGARREGIRK